MIKMNSKNFFSVTTVSNAELLSFEDKYLFTFQDESQLWISREFIEKYHQLPFYDIIEHSEKYDDGSYYIDIPSSSMKTVIQFLMDKTTDIFSLNLKESYDIYIILVEYSVTIDKEIQSDLLFHVKELFYKYLKDNNYNINGYYLCDVKLLPIELFNLVKKDIHIKNDYSSNIPLEYICPSCIKDIFPSLKNVEIAVTTHYQKTDVLLNPNSDEYIMEYIRLLSENNYKIKNPKKNKYYTESEMNEYNKISSLDLNKLYYSQDMIDSYNKRREKNELPKLYRYVVNETIYTDDYSNIEMSKTEDEYTLKDKVSITYDDKTKDKTLSIHEVSSEYGISQLLLLPSYMYWDFHCNPMFFMKLFEEGVLDSLTTLSIKSIKELTNRIDKNLFNKIMTTHIFPNVTEFIYDDYDYNDTKNFDSLFPANLMSMIDIIRINYVDDYEKEEIGHLLDNFVYSHSIHIDTIGIDEHHDFIYYLPHLKELLEKNFVSFNDHLSIYSSRSGNIKNLYSIENYNQNIDRLNIEFKDDNQDRIDIRNSLERFLKSNILKHLNNLDVSFDDYISIEYLTWISTLFNDNKFNTIHKLEIDLRSIKKDSSSEALTAYENILEKLVSKASIVIIEDWALSFINRLIPKGCFHKTTQLFLKVYDMPNDNFCKLYTTNNFPQLKTIKFYSFFRIKWWSSFIKIFCNYINNNNFPSSSIVKFGKKKEDDYEDYVYNHNTSILRCKYDNNSFMNTLIGNKEETMSTFEIEILFECINTNKIHHLRELILYIYNEEELSNLINFIITGKIPKLKEFVFHIIISDHDSYETITIYEQQLMDSSFVKENNVHYTFNTMY
ncbi:hypothetical protein WA158_000817 [Blastocystis sp. Blastoise]